MEVKGLSRTIFEKWLTVPLAIIMLVNATVAENACVRWSLVSAKQGYSYYSNLWIQVVFLFGYLGCLPGFIVHHYGIGVSYCISAVFGLLGFWSLGIFSVYAYGSPAHMIFTMLSMFIAGISASLAFVAAFTTAIQNFTKKGAMLVSILLIAYFKICSLEEASWRNSLLADIETKLYYPGAGAYFLIAYFIGSWLMKKVEIDDKYTHSFEVSDKSGILMYIIIQVACVGLMYYFFILEGEFFISLIIMDLVLLVNLLIIFIAIKKAKNNLEGGSTFSRFSDEDDQQIDKELSECLQEPKFYSLFIASGLILGTTLVFIWNISRVSAKIQHTIPYQTYTDLSWLCDILTRIGGGLIAFFLSSHINPLNFALFGSILATTGFVIFIIENLFIGTMLISFAMGLWWVIPLLYIIKDSGRKAFAGLWGTILTSIFWGILFNGLVFNIIMTSMESPLMSICIFFAAQWFIAGALTVWSLFKYP